MHKVYFLSYLDDIAVVAEVLQLGIDDSITITFQITFQSRARIDWVLIKYQRDKKVI